MSILTPISLTLWCALCAAMWAMRRELHVGMSAARSADDDAVELGSAGLATQTTLVLCASLIGLLTAAAIGWLDIPPASAVSGAGALALAVWFKRSAGKGLGLFRRRAAEERAWIIRQRGTVQDQIMRACEREAMERRLRRCQATLMMTRRGGRDLGRLFRRLEAQVATMSEDNLGAAGIIGAFAAHLRHVFMESDRDDIPLGEVCHHIERWASVLRALGCGDVTITGSPSPASPQHRRRVPAMLLLGATERLGMAALESEAGAPLHWRWVLEEHTVRLESEGGGGLAIPDADLRDWDAAFMLRHGGIAHAGGVWSFELPLLPA